MRNSLSKPELLEILKSPIVMERGREYTLSSGISSNLYFKVKQAYGLPRFLRSVSRDINNLMDKKIRHIAGMGKGGTPLVGSYAGLYPIYSCYIRDVRKSHGMNLQIEGILPKRGDKVALLDDVFTTGKSLEEEAEILERITGAEVVAAYVVLRRTNAQINFPVKSIFNIGDLDA
ncbi:MAG: hypothetical protein IH845_02180 [Nanoarchaeota archaeon]|nr:hypothetical protein [Nanoarchaeota archaeon]